LLQANSVRADNKTYQAADKISRDLESYISAKNKIPAKLSEATKESIPETVKYTKLSSSRYKFCVTYKAASSDLSASDISARVLSSTYSSEYQSDQEETYLYLSPSHKKGENCQTIKPYINDYYTKDSDSLFNSTSDCKYDSSLGSKAYDAYFDCIDKAYGDTNSQSI
jgi:hypothetical protein